MISEEQFVLDAVREASESRHTGWQIKEKPWLLHSCHWSKAITSQESGETVVIAETDDDHARLIAAAPDMLAIHQDSVEILEAVLEDREYLNCEEDEVLRDLISRIKSAIARAEARQS